MNRLLCHVAAATAMACTLLFAMFPSTASADARDDLHAAYAKMLGSRFATETVATDAKGKQTRSVGEFDTSERMRMITDSGGFVILPEGMWMRAGADGPWSKPPFDMSGMLKNVLPQSLDELRSSATNIRDEGTKSVDGANLRAISYDLDTKVMGISVSAHTVVFLDAEGRIVRAESDGVAMGKKTRSVQTTRYDDSIRITAPD